MQNQKPIALSEVEAETTWAIPTPIATLFFFFFLEREVVL